MTPPISRELLAWLKKQFHVVRSSKSYKLGYNNCSSIHLTLPERRDKGTIAPRISQYCWKILIATKNSTPVLQ